MIPYGLYQRLQVYEKNLNSITNAPDIIRYHPISSDIIFSDTVSNQGSNNHAALLKKSLKNLLREDEPPKRL